MITLSVIISVYPIVLFFSVKISWTIFKSYISRDLNLFLTSISILLSIIFEIVTLTMQLISQLSYEKRTLFFNLFRQFSSMTMCFTFFAFIFDIFKWITFLVSASVETSVLNEVEKEKLLSKRNT